MVKKSIHNPRYEAMIKILRDARKKADLTQEALSEKLGQHRLYITKIESGQRRVDVWELYELCQALEISIYTLIESTIDKGANKVMRDNADYILGFSNGYLLGRGYETDDSIKDNIFSKLNNTDKKTE